MAFVLQPGKICDEMHFRFVLWVKRDTIATQEAHSRRYCPMKKPVLQYRTIILSDLHLGTADCKVEEVTHFLKHTRAAKLILNGDIIDAWAIQRGHKWTREHTKCVRRLLKIAQRHDAEIIYVRGNHDDFLRHYLPLELDALRFVEDYELETTRGRYLVMHGDAFDAVTTHTRFLAVLGDIGYQTLLKVNRLYNKWRAWRGQEYYSISKAIKARVKQAVSHVGRFEEHLRNLAHKRGCAGVICGHIHTPEDKMLDDVHYLNSGDWVESLTAIVEHEDGRFEVLTYKEFCLRLEAVAQGESGDAEPIRPVGAPHLVPEPVTWHSEEELAAQA
jgi:UDP-2,3-diacylglucosamine pyrophosphatase LpxH